MNSGLLVPHIYERINSMRTGATPWSRPGVATTSSLPVWWVCSRRPFPFLST